MESATQDKKTLQKSSTICCYLIGHKLRLLICHWLVPQPRLLVLSSYWLLFVDL